MTSQAAARWPAAPSDARYLTDPTAAFDAAVEAVLAQVETDFGRTLGAVDGTRSEQVRRWTGEIRRVAELQDPDLARAKAEHIEDQNAEWHR